MKTREKRQAERKEKSILRIMTTCVPFTGIQRESCNAGVNYHHQFGSEAGCFAHIPCTHEGEQEVKECSLVSDPTREQAEKEHCRIEEESKKHILAINAAHADAKSRGYGVGRRGEGSIKCPLCPEGIIRYRVASVNGHMAGACSNGCISWME